MACLPHRALPDLRGTVPRRLRSPCPFQNARCRKRSDLLRRPSRRLCHRICHRRLYAGAEKIIPNGDTRLSAGDTLVLSALSVAPVTGLALSEIHVAKKSRYYQKSLSSLHLPNGHLVVLILRQGEVIIPKGDTVLEAGDLMVMNGKNE